MKKRQYDLPCTGPSVKTKQPASTTLGYTQPGRSRPEDGSRYVYYEETDKKRKERKVGQGRWAGQGR